MSTTVSFKISPLMAYEIDKLMHDEGIESKAEFFRFLLKFYKYQRPTPLDEFDEAHDIFEQQLKTYKKRGKIPSIKEQLKDV